MEQVAQAEQEARRIQDLVDAKRKCCLGWLMWRLFKLFVGKSAWFEFMESEKCKRVVSAWSSAQDDLLSVADVERGHREC